MSESNREVEGCLVFVGFVFLAFVGFVLWNVHEVEERSVRGCASPKLMQVVEDGRRHGYLYSCSDGHVIEISHRLP